MLQISRILHAGYIFQCEGTQILFDPIFENPFSRNCHAFPQVQFDHEKIKNLQCDAVFISHFHDDHCSLQSLDFLNRKTPIHLYCLSPDLFALIRSLGFTSVFPLTIDTPVRVGPFAITPRQALDSEIDSIFQIQAGDLQVLNVVDSWIDSATIEKLAKEKPWDMVLWPFQTLREIEVLSPSRAGRAETQLPPEWIEQLKILSPRYVVPSSCQFLQEDWSWYNHWLFPISYEQFQQEIQAALPHSSVVRLNPSVSVLLSSTSLQVTKALDWIHPQGEQDGDYIFQADLRPPSTAQISTKFAPLDSLQTEKVFNYCDQELLEKYRSLGPPLDIYFEKPRHWRLSLYDHLGQVTHKHYSIEGAQIEIVIDPGEPLAWCTEVPLSKLYAALELGESMTSMYLRINDQIFDSDIEKEIQSADILEDPLIRCLFLGVSAAYQKAQLRQLSSYWQ